MRWEAFLMPTIIGGVLLLSGPSSLALHSHRSHPSLPHPVPIVLLLHITLDTPCPATFVPWYAKKAAALWYKLAALCSCLVALLLCPLAYPKLLDVVNLAIPVPDLRISGATVTLLSGDFFLCVHVEQEATQQIFLACGSPTRVVGFPVHNVHLNSQYQNALSTSTL